jgi:hypothetical protein
VELLDSQGENILFDISIAIRGFGIFSGAIIRFTSMEELKKRCAKLFQFSERFFSSDFEQLDETSFHLPSFINGFATTILFMDTVEEVYIDHFEKLVGAVFVFYPQLRWAQKQQYAKALSRLFTALYAKGSALQDLLSRISTSHEHQISLFTHTNDDFNLLLFTSL